MGGHKEESFREDRWMGEGREGGQWSEVIIRWEMGSELRRGEWRGKKKGEAAL